MDRQKLRKMILKEFKMMGMQDMGSIGVMGLGKGGHHGHDAMSHSHGGHDDFEYREPVDMNQHHSHGGVSKEDCCKAVMCLIECCDCPETKSLLKQCCEDILSRC